MVEKVKPLKIETLEGGGGELDLTPTEINPSEDYLASKGLAIENNDNILFDAESGEFQYKDAVQLTPLKLNDISNFSYHVVALGKNLNIKANQHMITTSLELEGSLELNGGIVLL